jgi:hypothetical protein
MSSNPNILANQLIKEIVSIRIDTLWKMIGLKRQGMLPDLNRCGGCHAGRDSRELRLGSPDLSIRCNDCGPDGGVETRVPGADSLSFLLRAGDTGPVRLLDTEKACRPGGTLEWFLRRGLEAFVERGFRSYRHLRAVAAHGAGPAAKA